MKATARKIGLVLNLLLVLGGICAFTTAPVSAATQTVSLESGVAIKQAKITQQKLSDSECAYIKAQFPKDISNPNMCIAYHEEISTGSTQQVNIVKNGVSPFSCTSGTRSFQDVYWTFDAYHVTLNTNWSWNGNCSIPTITYEYCNVDWTIGDQINNSSCGQYTTGVPSRAALWTGTLVRFNGWASNGIFARRECYTNINACNWHTDLG